MDAFQYYFFWPYMQFGPQIAQAGALRVLRQGVYVPGLQRGLVHLPGMKRGTIYVPGLERGQADS